MVLSCSFLPFPGKEKCPASPHQILNPETLTGPPGHPEHNISDHHCPFGCIWMLLIHFLKEKKNQKSVAFFLSKPIWLHFTRFHETFNCFLVSTRCRLLAPILRCACKCYYTCRTRFIFNNLTVLFVYWNATVLDMFTNSVLVYQVHKASPPPPPPGPQSAEDLISQ